MLLVFSVVGDITLAASENTLDITDPYSFTRPNAITSMCHIYVIKRDTNTMYNINQAYHFSRHTQ